MNLPILYSFRRCPYAIRARMAIAYSQTQVELREVVLKQKPKELITISPKATVPVLQLKDGTVLEESLDIMHWALLANDPDKFNLSSIADYYSHELIQENDGEFKQALDHYKYADRFPEFTVDVYRQQCETFIQKLEACLSHQTFLTGDRCSAVDFAIFPFVRQFAYVDINWFDSSNYVNVRHWLNGFLRSELFESIMFKFPQWTRQSEITLFPIQINEK